MISCAGSLRPRKSTGNREDKAGDSTFCTKKKAANFFTNSLLLVIVWAAFATKGKKGSSSLLPVPHAAFTKGFQLGDDRNNCGWIFHNLVHAGNGQTTSSFDIWSLRRRESTGSIQPRQATSHVHKKYRLQNSPRITFSSSAFGKK